MLGARLASGTSGIMSVTVGVLYLLPEQLVRRPLQPGQVSAVVLIESLGPWWTILFVSTGIILITAALRRRGFVNAHIFAAGVWAFYAGCVLFSAVLAVPPVPVVSGTISGFVAVLQMSLARGCVERGLR